MNRRKRGEEERFELAWNAKDGRKIYTITSPRGLFDGKGNFTGCLAVLTDITVRRQLEEALRKANLRAKRELERLVDQRTGALLEANEQLKEEIEKRKQAEEALALSEQKYRLLVQSADEGIVVSQDKILRFVNPKAAEISGYSEEELISRPFIGFVHADDRETVMEHHLRRLSGKEKPKPYDFRIVDKAGNTKWVRNNGVIIDWQGKPATLNFLSDITESKRAEERIRMLAQELISAQEIERQRLAADLHDNLAQDLAALRIGLESLYADEKDTSAETRPRVRELSALLEHSIMAVRDMAYGLHPSSLEEFGLVYAAREYCEEFAGKNDVTVDFFSVGVEDLELDFETEITFYRLIQEGLANINKHADASHINVRLSASFSHILLHIEDNGKGFDVRERLKAALGERRMGIWGMEQRVAFLNGEMKIESRRLHGTKVLIKVPYKDKSNG
jgi:PAS domain S-box-containing protein